ncbi:integrase [Amycolatopsis bartoniae]|uniref:DMT family permease n=1 Tax=Amycolatopsis bartoniae TaxID=941986 RepID=A0A8H9IXS0_9PSEU|nr:tyrosine-type recombinase/integrase [Amycolatopsis bartoniae]MBB2940213.1 integrase [Amycolatopsis bartoniae]GHF66456.1 DMT family permease [Amycolatopsis bartoniae]
MSWIEHTSGQHWRVRYRRLDGSVASEGGFTDPTAARHRAKEIDVDQRRYTFYDTTRGRITVAQWLPHWWSTLSLDEVTLDNYAYLIGKHINPRFGNCRLGDLHASDITQWAADLHASGYQHTTVEGITSLFSRILGDAADDGLIPANPVHRHRNRGKRAFRIRHEMLWATPEEVLRAATQAEHLHDRASAALIITAAWTGCQWGELAGLQRHNLHLDNRTLVIDPDHGALKETAHRQWLGPPKTPASTRTITLPAFLTMLLTHHLADHDSPLVFPNEAGGFLWRHTWLTRTFNPAFDGNHDVPNPRARTYPIRPGLTFHGLRHSHKTWLIAAGIPEIAQARRLGHRMDRRIVEVYSHVADELETQIQTALKHAWLEARHTIAQHPTRGNPPPGPNPPPTHPRAPQGPSSPQPPQGMTITRRPAQTPRRTG